MNPPVPASFLFATCNAGREGSLKGEIRSRYGAALVPTFLRPGLVTWKRRDASMWEETGPLPVFAHVFGQSLGMAKTESDLPALAARLGEAPLRLHVFPRVLPENGFSKEEWARIDERRTGIARTLEQAGLALAPGEKAQNGEAVVDVILGDPGEALFVGWHRHDARRRPFPGGMPRASLPDGAPSRAWLKMEQALACLGLDEPASLRGRCAVELGSAPGGGSLALLGHGARVVGVDPGEMDPRVLAHAGPEGAAFTHLPIAAGEVAFGDLPRRVDLLVSDMNLAPPVALRYVERLQRRVRARTLVLTLKINDAKMESSIPDFLGQVRRFSPAEPRATQLPSNRREITVLAHAPR